MIGGFIFKTFPFIPSRLTRTCFYRIIKIIFAAVYPSYYLVYLDFTISIPWNKPTPLISPTKSYLLKS